MPNLPIEAEAISPDSVVWKTQKEVSALPVHFGNMKSSLGDFFKISGKTAENPSDQLIVISGEVPKVKYIGAGMSTGQILVEGCVGMHVGAQMKGGELIITGNATDNLIHQAGRLGGCRVMLKPVEIEKFLQELIELAEDKCR